MSEQKKEAPKEKTNLHPRNKHRERYDFKLLTASCPALAAFVIPNFRKDDSIDFANPFAVKTLNKALLKHYYEVENWDIPENYLCPPIPGRADYIHHIADLIRVSNFGNIPTGSNVRCLDIGVGANCVYPLIGNHEYGWQFIGTDIDPVSVESARSIVAQNARLKDQIEIRLQLNPKDIFYGVVQREEFIDIVVCNPPFHASKEEAEAGTLRKLRNLNGTKIQDPVLNFGGQHGELFCQGGEAQFIRNIVKQSRQFTENIFWFSTLVSKQSNLKNLYEMLEKANALQLKTIPMGQGNKTSRIVAWTFLTKTQQKEWREKRWKI